MVRFMNLEAKIKMYFMVRFIEFRSKDQNVFLILICSFFIWIIFHRCQDQDFINTLHRKIEYKIITSRMTFSKNEPC